MASAEDHVYDLCQEATCPICLDYFKNPVTIKCGHNFCHDCLDQFWWVSEEEASCPECRQVIQQRDLTPNWQLARFVEITQKLSHQTRKRKKGDCREHQEPLKLFCKDDETPICLVCFKSKKHENHNVVPVEEAIQEYKKQTQTEMEKMMAEFRKLHQFLEEQERLWLAQMKEVQKEVSEKSKEHLAKLSQELSSLESLMQEMEEQKQQPASEILQDMKTLLQRSKDKTSFENPLTFPLELRWKLCDICDRNPFLVGVIQRFKDALLPGLKLQKANVTLDPDTAHAKLILSEDCKSVTYGDQFQHLPDKLKRFNKSTSVLGCEGFTAGRHFWEICVGEEDQWLAGVARKSVKRMGDIIYGPEGGIWAIGMWNGTYRVTNHPHYSPVSQNRDLRRVRVSLNYAGGQVAFYDADTGAHLYTFFGASFTGKTLLPFFNVIKKGQLRIPP
ncbi:zinc finger protein RFP-like [Anolis carolinensis]|uniref:zinc finger protein RFP-like n=1 Tax=Anolis carolinensis TaxID=28377 RepID=UPI002F2B9051